MLNIITHGMEKEMHCGIQDKTRNHWNGNKECLLTIICSYNKCIQLDDKYTKAWIGKGNALLNLKQYQEALEW